MANLKLVTSESFGSAVCDCYRNINGDLYFTREQIGTALEYANPSKAIKNIHSRHKDRLDKFSMIMKLPSSDGKEYETYVYTIRGLIEICLLSRQPAADKFIDWYWDIKLRKYNIAENQTNLVEINHIPLYIKEINNNRVVTFKDIDQVHERPEGTARQAFTRNKHRFIENEDYYLINRENISNFSMYVSWTLESIPPKGVTYITESGYLMIAKVFDDDLAWEVQRKLVNNYFRSRENKEFSTNNDVLNQTLITLNTTLSVMQEELKQIRYEQEKSKVAAKKVNGNTKPSLFARSMFPKYRAIEGYFKLNRKELYHKLYLTLERLYEIDLDSIKQTYCMENGLSDCFLMDAIESRKDLREKLKKIVDRIIEKWGIDVDENEETNAFELT